MFACSEIYTSKMARCFGVLAFSAISQLGNGCDKLLLDTVNDVRKRKKDNKHPFRFKLILTDSSGGLQDVWEFYGIRRCCEITPKEGTVCRQCIVRCGKNEEYRSKNHGRIDNLFENRTSKLYGSPEYLKRIAKGYSVDPHEERLCLMLQAFAINSIVLRPMNIENGSVTPSQEALINNIQTDCACGDSCLVPVLDVRGSKQILDINNIDMPPKGTIKNTVLNRILSDIGVEQQECNKNEKIKHPPILPEPRMIETGKCTIYVRDIIYQKPVIEIIDGVKHYVCLNGHVVKAVL